MNAVAVGGLHDYEVGRLTLSRTGMHDLARRNFVVAHSSNVASEEQSPGLAIGSQRYFRHARSQNMRRADEAKRQLG